MNSRRRLFRRWFAAGAVAGATVLPAMATSPGSAPVASSSSQVQSGPNPISLIQNAEWNVDLNRTAVSRTEVERRLQALYESQNNDRPWTPSQIAQARRLAIENPGAAASSYSDMLAANAMPNVKTTINQRPQPNYKLVDPNGLAFAIKVALEGCKAGDTNSYRQVANLATEWAVLERIKGNIGYSNALFEFGARTAEQLLEPKFSLGLKPPTPGAKRRLEFAQYDAYLILGTLYQTWGAYEPAKLDKSIYYVLKGAKLQQAMNPEMHGSSAYSLSPFRWCNG